MKIKTPFLYLFHICFSLFILYVFRFLGFFGGELNISGLLNWDAGWIFNLVKNGYFFSETSQSNVAYFPLFPIIWKSFGLSAVGVSLLNLTFYFIGLSLLRKAYGFDNKFLLLFLAIPSTFFCFLPYTEALFFLSCSIVLYGYRRSFPLLVFGLLLACLTRSASMIFIPIIIISNLFNLDFSMSNLKRVAIQVGVCIVAFFLVQYYQYLECGKMLGVFDVGEHWDRDWGVPQLFLTTWDKGRLVWLDGLAFMVGIFCLTTCFILLIRKIKKQNSKVAVDLLFAIGYLSVVTLSTSLYTGEDAAGGSTLLSLNRYVFCTPFFVVLFHYLLKLNFDTKKSFFFFALFSLVIWSAFGFWDEINIGGTFKNSKTSTKIYFLFVFIYSYAHLLLSNRKIRTQLWVGVYFINVVLQLFLFNNFLNGMWIG